MSWAADYNERVAAAAAAAAAADAHFHITCALMKEGRGRERGAAVGPLKLAGGGRGAAHVWSNVISEFIVLHAKTTTTTMLLPPFERSNAAPSTPP